jgi:putative 4-mercaptohistidine N1-methyltranferase
VGECLDTAQLPPDAQALDLGCAVGRASFELARHCPHVLGIDFSKRFVEAASQIAETGSLEYNRIDEGNLTTRLNAIAPTGIDRKRVRFEVGDAMNPRRDLGSFDVVLMANLIDRLREPALCPSRLDSLVKPGGQLIITSPYTWLLEFTPSSNWLGGVERGGERISTLDGLREALDRSFDLKMTRDLPFLIREHARKFQLSVAQASVWLRRPTLTAV